MNRNKIRRTVSAIMGTAMAASGHVTQFVIRHEKPSGKKD